MLQTVKPAVSQAARLAELRRKSGLSLYAAAEAINKHLPEGKTRSHATIQRYEKDPTIAINMDVMRALAKVYKTTTEYIEHGETPVPGRPPVPKHEGLSEVLGTMTDTIFLPFISYSAYGSFVAGCQDRQFDDMDRFIILKRPGIDYTNAVVIEVRGNSMAPRYPDRSCHVVRPVSDGNWQYATGVHAITLRNEMFLIKRIKSNKEGHIVLASDNNDETMSIELGDINCMWKVGEAAYMPAEE